MEQKYVSVSGHKVPSKMQLAAHSLEEYQTSYNCFRLPSSSPLETVNLFVFGLQWSFIKDHGSEAGRLRR